MKRFHSWMRRNRKDVDLYLKVFGLIFALGSLLALLLQIDAVVDQNRTMSDQNHSIAMQAEAVAKQNEMMWFANRPVLKLQQVGKYFPTVYSENDMRGPIKFEIKNVGYTTATLNYSVIEILTENGLSVDTVQYSSFQMPTTDAFDQSIEFPGSDNISRFLKITIYYSWEQSLGVQANFELERVYVVKLSNTEGWLVQLKARDEFDRNLEAVKRTLGGGK